ncbi:MULTISPECIES: hypothetical protein [Streptomyces]|uniref:hypothetical protein n=1 Tax=Streptomyces TaxID=1883 RepID=UPI0004CCBDAD|nr:MULTISPECIES: hypothetical protein [Streptomyces]KOT57103.1 hypothetical protein ADK43_22020 [Streptomyces rimosus subsp. rimosus]
MSAQTLKKTETTALTNTTAAAKKTTVKPVEERKGSKLRAGWRALAPRKDAGRFSVVVWAGFFRAIVLLADYLLAFITAMVVIPLLGAWLHQQSGAAKGVLSTDGTIAMWLMPLLFLVALLAAGEIVVMRVLWRWATRMIAKIRDARDVAAKLAARTTNQSRTNSKRSK